uniref:Uncharacterized protein n=1 Tax=Tanacetum cinerariifolium TaxID=118510 RepID=A0A6L2LUZ4_TANCI|nr:hypothetical protein [Tanacetum cinerariifolium]
MHEECGERVTYTLSCLKKVKLTPKEIESKKRNYWQKILKSKLSLRRFLLNVEKQKVDAVKESWENIVIVVEYNSRVLMRVAGEV